MKSKKKRVREITDYIKFVFPMLILYILFLSFHCFRQSVTLLQITME